MSNILKQYLSTPTEVVEPVGNILEAHLSLESATIEVLESEHEVTMATYAEEELDSAYLTLEAIAMSLEALIEADEAGLTRQTAEAYTHAISAVVGDAAPMPVASLESFGGDTERAEASQLSLEGVKELLKNVWEGIKRAISATVKAVTDFFSKLFVGSDKLKKAIDATAGAAKDLKGEPKEDKVKVGSANAATLSFKGKFDVSAMMEGIAAMQLNYKVFNMSADVLPSSLEVLIKSLQSAEKNPQTFVDWAKSIWAKSEIKEAAELPGGKALAMKDDMVTFTTMDQADPKYKAFKDTDGGEMKVMSSKEMIDALNSINELVKSADSKKKTRQEMIDIRNKATKATEVWIGKVAGDEEGPSDKDVQKVIRIASRNDITTISKMDGFVFSYARSVLSTVKAQMANYVEEKKDDKEDK